MTDAAVMNLDPPLGDARAPRCVHIVDDDQAARDSLSFLLTVSGFQVRTYAAARDLLAVLPAAPDGCVITDVRMPGVSGLELLETLKTVDKSWPVIVMTGHGDVPLAVQALKFGAVDFLEKPFDQTSIVRAIENALGPRPPRRRDPMAHSETALRFASLSVRESQVLDGLVAGKVNKVIAWDLGISPRTVEVYRANVMAKMRAANLAELVRMAVQTNRGR